MAKYTKHVHFLQNGKSFEKLHASHVDHSALHEHVTYCSQCGYVTKHS